jgi:hypothetical protein
MIWLADIIGASGRFRSVRAKFMNDAKTKLTRARGTRNRIPAPIPDPR